MDMSATMTRVGAMVSAALLLGALTGKAAASDTPPVMQQTATVEGAIPQDHPHPQLKNWTITNGKKTEFKVKLKFLRRYLRYFAVKGDLFNEMQKPGLFLINGEYDPLSEHSFEIELPCNPPSLKCFRVKNFPYAFGIHPLKNPDGTESPHAFLYIPARLESSAAGSNRLPYTGDSFALAVFHIPEDDSYCDTLHHEISKRHCRVIYGLNQLNGQHSEGRFAIEIQRTYRCFLDHLLDGASFDKTTGKLLLDGSPVADFASLIGPKPSVNDFANILQVILSHNEIVHGNLK